MRRVILVLLYVIELDGTITSQEVLRDSYYAIFYVLVDPVHEYNRVSRYNLDTCDAVGDLAALYLRTIALMYTHTDAVDVIYFRAQ